MIKNAKIVFTVVVSILIIVGMLAVMSLFGKFAGIKEEKLESYAYGSGGGMLGGSYSESVLDYNEDSALITIMQSKWHGDDGTVKEYLVDKEILDELKTVFIKYHMKNWDNKKFTNMFIADGASRSYRFIFEIKSVSFSSQYYPEKYASKLAELDAILDKYLKKATPLPGLLIHDTIMEDGQTLPYDLNNGEIVLSVYSYYQKYLYYRLANGTDEKKKMESVIRLYKDDKSTPIYEKSSEFKTLVYAHCPNEDFIELEERLAPGKYRLEVFGYTTEFEIQ